MDNTSRHVMDGGWTQGGHDQACSGQDVDNTSRQVVDGGWTSDIACRQCGAQTFSRPNVDNNPRHLWTASRLCARGCLPYNDWTWSRHCLDQMFWTGLDLS